MTYGIQPATGIAMVVGVFVATGNNSLAAAAVFASITIGNGLSRWRHGRRAQPE